MELEIETALFHQLPMVRRLASKRLRTTIVTMVFHRHPEFREAVAKYVNDEYGLNVAASNVTAGQKFLKRCFVKPINENDGFWF